jgi:hypothetical protein
MDAAVRKNTKRRRFSAAHDSDSVRARLCVLHHFGQRDGRAGVPRYHSV